MGGAGGLGDWLPMVSRVSLWGSSLKQVKLRLPAGQRQQWWPSGWALVCGTIAAGQISV